MNRRSLTTNQQLAIGSGLGFLVLAVIGFVFVSATSGVIMLVLALVWPPLFVKLYGDGKDRPGRINR